MQRSLAELQQECEVRNLKVVQSGKRPAKKDYILALQTFFLQDFEMTPGMAFRLTMASTQLAMFSGHLTPQEEERIFNSDRYVFEEKKNGIRMVDFYAPDTAFEFHSRNLSVTDYLPVPYTEKIFLSDDDLAGFPYSFALDSEIISNDPRISTEMDNRGVITETPLQAVAALLALNKEDSIRIQRELGGPLELHAFDCLMKDGVDLRRQPYAVRRKALTEVIDMLQGFGLPFFKVKAVLKRKKEYLEYLWSQGLEGCIGKPIDMPYVDRESRSKKGWVKFKRTVSGAIGESVDGWISGFEPGNPKRGFAKLVGALHISVFLKDGESDVEHMVARVANIPLALRKQMTEYDAEGNPQLKQAYYGIIVEVEGQSVSARAHRLNHPRMVRFRDDKSKMDCVISKEDLMSLIV